MSSVISTVDLKLLSNEGLHRRILDLVAQERAITLEVLHHLRAVETRRLFAAYGYPSLFEYAVKELTYSESAAQRRISAMRALKELPELEEKIQAGELKVTQVAQVQSFFRAEKKEGKAYSTAEKRQVFEMAVGKSTRETEKLLLEKSPSYALHAGNLKERTREITPALTQLVFNADEDLMKKLQEIRDRYAQRLPVGASQADVIRFMADFVLKNDPMLKPTRVEKKLDREGASQEALDSKSARKEDHRDRHAIARGRKGISTGSVSLPAPKTRGTRIVRSRYIPKAIQRLIWRRDYPQGCAVIRNGRRCGSRHRLQIDHVTAFARGGSSNDPENLRLACFHHNQLAAQEIFGSHPDDRFISSSFPSIEGASESTKSPCLGADPDS